MNINISKIVCLMRSPWRFVNILVFHIFKCEVKTLFKTLMKLFLFFYIHQSSGPNFSYYLTVVLNVLWYNLTALIHI